MSYTALIAVLIMFFPCIVFSGEDAAEKARELDALRSQIQSLQKKLESNRKKKTTAQKKLHAVESRINEASRALRHIDRELKTSRKQLDGLNTEQQLHAANLSAQRSRLADEARAAYAMGRQQHVKMLLNQEQPSAVGRMMVYYSYFSRARKERIDAIRGTLQELDQLEISIERKTGELIELRNQQRTESDQLQAQKRERKKVLAQLIRELDSQGGELKQLKTNEQQLEDLVYSLQELLADIPPDVSQQQPFKVRKGKLHWPVRGRLTKRFGNLRSSSGLKWQGVIINAPEGGNVRAVSQGRVAFADWMRGFGLLLIIDHGDGYMSLYGHNQALYKEVGEWVDTGEVVATVGASGGQTDAGLYFELRHNGRPIDPVKWCSGKPVPLSG